MGRTAVDPASVACYRSEMSNKLKFASLQRRVYSIPKQQAFWFLRRLRRAPTTM
jgi:hypothetical protein